MKTITLDGVEYELVPDYIYTPKYELQDGVPLWAQLPVGEEVTFKGYLLRPISHGEIDFTPFDATEVTDITI